MLERKKQILEFWDRSGRLSLQNGEYKKYLLSHIYKKLDEDGFNNDITTTSLIEPNKKIKAQIIARAAGIIAGVEEISYFFEKENVKVINRIKDCSAVKNEDIVLAIEGDARKILTFERTVLNILQRMSGIATMTHNLKNKINNENCFVAGTRKALSLLDKKAVSAGGGLTHRLNLEDAVLIKDNHLRVLDTDSKKAVETALNRINMGYQINTGLGYKKIEIEVNNEDEALTAVKTIKNKKNFSEKRENTLHSQITEKFFAVMLDNMEPNTIKNTIDKIKKLGCYDKVLFEASGDINGDNIAGYSESGVDVVSVGALTHSVRAFNISLRIV